MLQQGLAAGKRGRTYLLVRMYVLRIMQRDKTGFDLSELRRRPGGASKATAREARDLSCIDGTRFQTGRMCKVDLRT